MSSVSCQSGEDFSHRCDSCPSKSLFYVRGSEYIFLLKTHHSLQMNGGCSTEVQMHVHILVETCAQNWDTILEKRRKKNKSQWD